MYEAGYVIGVIVGALVMGLVIGAIPLIIGFKKGKKGLGIAGFVTCTILSFLAGLFLSVPSCIIFTVIIFVTSKKKPDEGNVTAENSNDN